MHERSRYTYRGEMRPGSDRPEWGGIFGFPGEFTPDEAGFGLPFSDPLELL